MYTKSYRRVEFLEGLVAKRVEEHPGQGEAEVTVEHLPLVIRHVLAVRRAPEPSRLQVLDSQVSVILSGNQVHFVKGIPDGKAPAGRHEGNFNGRQSSVGFHFAVGLLLHRSVADYCLILLVAPVIRTPHQFFKT